MRTKLELANLDLENDELAIALNRKKNQANKLSEKVNSLEIDLAKYQLEAAQHTERSDDSQEDKEKKKGRMTKMKNFLGFGKKSKTKNP